MEEAEGHRVALGGTVQNLKALESWSPSEGPTDECKTIAAKFTHNS